MKLLLIDACGAAASLALADSGRSPAVFAQSVLAERSAAAQLLPAVRDLLAGAKLTLEDLDAITVIHGPGSFTGVRIGVSAAKGLSEGASKPVIAISRLAVLASLCPSERVHPVLDAGRGEFYVGSYRGLECLREDLLTHEELRAVVAAAPGVVCACEAHVAERMHDLEPCLVAEPVAADAFALACAAFTAKIFADVATLDANYLRRADAEMLEKQRAASAAKAK
ncbi:MAG TPA: tRNA (adenosine(37)-N6)-threonylcarbamoyltransferase complex dimerization subunit type 1 TsaB [Acidobacteriaceae bacterium]|jgi:tRNA threonylcarbamoyladenosine biosynthesis protein TsaB|nr:tRNA (adenosine(37)-N6)-threonylcarbamoyltransferase complex dimerization subunit type 1 TsaB [Acidobacteriaceae bacterium]